MVSAFFMLCVCLCVCVCACFSHLFVTQQVNVLVVRAEYHVTQNRFPFNHCNGFIQQSTLGWGRYAIHSDLRKKETTNCKIISEFLNYYFMNHDYVISCGDLLYTKLHVGNIFNVYKHIYVLFCFASDTNNIPQISHKSSALSMT